MPVHWKWLGNKVSKAIRDELDEILIETSNAVEEKAKMYCPVMGEQYVKGITKYAKYDPEKSMYGRYRGKSWTAKKSGALKNSIRALKSKYKKGGYIVMAGGKDTFYACVLGSNGNYVKQEKKHKEIGQIKKGDSVISQDGLMHKINYVNKFPAIMKPQLIEIESEYRNNQTHKLTVTQDHKILILRNGVNCWMPAGNLKLTDYVFSPIKKAHNKDTGCIKICLNCNKEYRKGNIGQGKKYCSPNCRYEHWAKGFNPHLGVERSEKTKLKLSENKKALFKKFPEKNINRILSQRGYKTNNELVVKKWLIKNHFDFEEQYPVGQHFVDFAIPKIQTFIEADGAFWHQNQQKDIERDIEIKKRMPDWTIIHLHFTDTRFSKNITFNPIEEVYYAQCNDSMNSFVNLNYFKPTKIINLKKFEYKQNSCAKHLYNLSVENVHSFVVGGIIVSNSFVELGTHKMQARPFLRRATKDAQAAFFNSLNRIDKLDVPEVPDEIATYYEGI